MGSSPRMGGTQGGVLEVPPASCAIPKPHSAGAHPRQPEQHTRMRAKGCRNGCCNVSENKRNFTSSSPLEGDLPSALVIFLILSGLGRFRLI